jgi:hypothetical protein
MSPACVAGCGLGVHRDEPHRPAGSWRTARGGPHEHRPKPSIAAISPIAGKDALYRPSATGRPAQSSRHTGPSDNSPAQRPELRVTVGSSLTDPAVASRRGDAGREAVRRPAPWALGRGGAWRAAIGLLGTEDAGPAGPGPRPVRRQRPYVGSQITCSAVIKSDEWRSYGGARMLIGSSSPRAALYAATRGSAHVRPIAGRRRLGRPAGDRAGRRAATAGSIRAGYAGLPGRPAGSCRTP